MFPFKIGIIGSRRRSTEDDYRKVIETFDFVLSELGHTGKERVFIISGGCPKGGDRFAERIAKERGYTITIHYPDWANIGKAAGFARNSNIAEDSQNLIACVASDRKGGTEDTIRKFKKYHTKQKFTGNIYLT